jgi:NADH-quinone oxidoreductase subunit G
VNEEWNCDKGRWAFTYATQPDRLVTPLIREDGVLRPASWPEAIGAAAAGLAAARGRAGVLTGGRLTQEDAYGYAKFARVALGSNDIDSRARPHSAEEAQFLAARVAGHGVEVSYADLERAPAVLLAGLEPEEESPIIFLRLRKAARRGRTAVLAVAPLASRGLAKMPGTLLPAPPGAETEVLTRLAAGAGANEAETAAAQALTADGAVILAGERLAEIPGALSAAVQLASATGAMLAWVPRRAGERGAIEAGALPILLPGGARCPTRRPAPRWPAPGASPRCPRRPAGTAARSSPPRLPVTWTPWSWPAWTWATCRSRSSRSVPSTPRPSW